MIALKNRRNKLQEDVRLRELRDRIQPQITHLEKTGEQYAVYYKFEHL